MENFGILLSLPMGVVVGFFYPRIAFFLMKKFAVLRFGLLLFSCVIALTLAYEIRLISSKGIVPAYDADPQFLDALTALNVVFAPAALTHFVLFALDKIVASKRVVKNVAGIMCCVAIWAAMVASLVYDDAAHYHTDSEGTYRIDEN